MHLQYNKFFLSLFLITFAFVSTNFIVNSNNQPPKPQFSENINDVSNIIEDDINSYCKGLDFEKYINLDESDIKNINIEIVNREKWFNNLFELSFEKNRSIDPKYKDEFNSNISFLIGDNLCVFEAIIRISGDWNDHIDKINLISSLDVKLLNGNILGITKFKLFIPKTRNGDNEIVIATFLEELGFLSPRTFYTKVGMINHNGEFTEFKYIFQEKLSKEMLEFNNYREAPLLEANESFFWTEVINNEFDLSTGNPLLISKSLNNYWVRKGQSQLKIALEGIEKFNQSIFNSYNSFVNVNYEYLGKNQNIFYKFDAANIALLGEHGLSTHQRKFYFDKLSNQFLPVYYDGNSNFIELGHIRWKNDYEEKNNLYLGAEELLNEVRINKESIYKKFTNRGLTFEKEFSDGLVDRFINNLKIISEQDKQKEPIYKNFTENSKNIKFPEDIFFVFIDPENNSVSECNTSLTNCKEIVDRDEFLNRFSNKININEGVGYVFGSKKDSFLVNKQNSEIALKIVENISIEIFGDPKVIIDKNNKKINIEFNDQSQKIKFIGPGKFENWQINAVSNIEINNDFERIDKNLLTGCITFYKVNLKNVSFDLKNLHCEDSLNLVRTNGTLSNLNIENSISDALDIDFSNIEINNVQISKSGNDCLDLSGGNYKINSFSGEQCFDKAISIGENSQVNIDNVEINSSYMGIAVKDSSIALIDSLNAYNTEMCFSTYRKKQEFGPSKLKIAKYNCSGLIKNFIQRGSEVEIGR